MKKRLTGIIALLLAAIAPSMAQQSYMAGEGIAVFYPANYDAAAHSPSPIFEHELAPVAQVPTSWQIRPVYSTADGKNICTLSVDSNADLYGGGEVSTF